MGQWKEGKKSGKGTYEYKKTGEKLVGIFENGDFIKGQWYIKEDLYFEGDFENNIPKGFGKWVNFNGNITKCFYEQKVIEEEEEEQKEEEKFKDDFFDQIENE